MRGTSSPRRDHLRQALLEADCVVEARIDPNGTPRPLVRQRLVASLEQPTGGSVSVTSSIRV